MARHIFAGDSVWQADGTPFAGQPFTLWDDLIAGNQITDVRGPDGTSSVTLITDNLGRRPVLRGPEAVKLMFCDTGAGIRFPMIGVDSLKDLLDNALGILSAATRAAAAEANSAASAAAAQASEQRLQEYINSGAGPGTGSGLTQQQAALLATQATNGVAVRRRALATVNGVTDRTGPWETRPDAVCIINVGYAPGPTEAPGAWSVDGTIEPS